MFYYFQVLVAVLYIFVFLRISCLKPSWEKTHYCDLYAVDWLLVIPLPYLVKVFCDQTSLHCCNWARTTGRQAVNRMAIQEWWRCCGVKIGDSQRREFRRSSVNAQLSCIAVSTSTAEMCRGVESYLFLPHKLVDFPGIYHFRGYYHVIRPLSRTIFSNTLEKWCMDLQLITVYRAILWMH